MTAKSSQVKSDGDGFPYIYVGTSQKVSFDGSVASTAVGAGTSLIRICATQDCHVKTAAAPTAVTDGTCMFLKSGVVEYIGIEPGHKIAAIKDSAAGLLYVTEAG